MRRPTLLAACELGQRVGAWAHERERVRLSAEEQPCVQPYLEVDLRLYGRESREYRIMSRGRP